MTARSGGAPTAKSTGPGSAERRMVPSTPEGGSAKSDTCASVPSGTAPAGTVSDAFASATTVSPVPVRCDTVSNATSLS